MGNFPHIQKGCESLRYICQTVESKDSVMNGLSKMPLINVSIIDSHLNFMKSMHEYLLRLLRGLIIDPPIIYYRGKLIPYLLTAGPEFK